ncbi:hypothetical protein BSKO_08281 [Bryopsis sp. KO-2023]|nr:hypothetical protein BSKO_08281 [Bryopsis sp. KO-2023]
MGFLRTLRPMAAAALILFLAFVSVQGGDPSAELSRGDVPLRQVNFARKLQPGNNAINRVGSVPDKTRRETGGVSSRVKIMAIVIAVGVGAFFIGVVCCCHRRWNDSDSDGTATVASSVNSNSCLVNAKRHDSYPSSEGSGGEIPAILVVGSVRRTDDYVIHASMPAPQD